MDLMMMKRDLEHAACGDDSCNDPECWVEYDVDEWLPLRQVARLLRRDPRTIKRRAEAGEFELRTTGAGRYEISKRSAMEHVAEMEERTNTHG